MILDKEKAPNTNFLEEIPCYLSSITSEGTYYGIQTIKGKLKNLDVTIKPDKVILTNSITKYLLGNNIQELGRSGLDEAFEKLADQIHLPIQKSKVSNLHWGVNLMLDYEPEFYFKHFGLYKNRIEPMMQPNGVYYRKTLCIYNKIAEMKHRRDYIPPIYQNRNVLRLEFRRSNKLPHLFNISELQVEKLTEEAFYIDLCNKLKEAYFNIYKIEKNYIDMREVKGVKDLKKMGVLAIIEKEGGLIEALNNLKERRYKKELEKKQYQDIRKAFIESSKMLLQYSKNEQIKELNEKVTEKFKYYR